MSQKRNSPLRQRMLEDMSLRGFTPDTQRDYIRAVKKLASFLGRSPDTATAEDLRAFQLHLTASGVQPPTINATVTVLRFFFRVTLDRPETTRHLVFVYEPRKLPRVLSPEEVLRLLEAAPGPKHKAALSVAYGAGLRAMEVVALKVSDIDSKRMMLRVEQGKGRKSLPSRKRGIALPCCRRSYWSCCATGGASPARRYGCSQAAIASTQ
jgi:integrase/recombinase XerD